MDLKYFFGIFLRRLPWIIVFAVIGAAAGLYVAMSLPASYRSQAVLIVESEQIPDEMAASTVRTGEIEALQIIRQRILTREVLLEMANRLNVYAGVEGAGTMSADDKVRDMRDRLQIETIGGSSPRGPAQATIVNVSFIAPVSQLAARVANEIVTLILQQNVQMRTTVAGQTLSFFTQEVDQLEQRLSDVSARILDFKENNLQALPDSLDFRRSQQASLQERMAQLSREESSLQERRDQMVALFDRAGPAGFSRQQASTRQLSPQEVQLEQLQNEYASLSAVLSDSNPRLAILKSRIDSLSRSISQVVPPSDDSDAAEDPARSLYEMQLADIDSQLDYIKTQRGSLEQQMDDLAATIAATPGNAGTLEALERNYANVQAQYNAAVAKRAQAETGNTIESLSKGQRISVVEQAVPPSQPSSPNRPLIAMGGFGGGMALGLGIVLLLELLNSAIRRPQDLTSALGIDALATIPYIRTARETRNRRSSVIAASLVLVLGIGAGIWYVDQQITPLQPLIADLLARLQSA